MAILLDTSILLASVFAKDKYHLTARKFLQSLRGELQIAPAPILTELFHMTRIRMNYAWAIKVFANTQASFQIEALTSADMLRMEQIMKQYADSRLDFADTAIMAQAERLNVTQIATFDHRDFEIFRPTHCDHLELLP